MPSVHAIVLKRKESGESDRRLTLLTRELGKIDAIAKGARKAASRLAGASDPLAVSVMSLAAGKRNLFVTQSQPLNAFRKLRTDFDRLSMALALVELYAAVLPYEQPDPEAFELLHLSLEHLETHPKPIVTLVWAEIRLLEAAGFQPQFGSCVATGAPIREAQGWVSPEAGGYISSLEADRYGDRFRVQAEVLYGLSRIGEFETPPTNLKFSLEALRALMPFWRHIADLSLPASDALLNHLRVSDLR